MKHLLPATLVGIVLSLGCAHRSQAQQGGTMLAQNHAAPTSAAAPAVPAVAIRPDSVFINPEVRPQFVGGEKAFSAYLSKSIRYPAKAMQRHVSGKVYVSFVLSAQGKVLDAHVVRGPGNGLDDEALRLVWLMPPWEPARVNGQPVRVACTMPITFNMER